MTLDRRLKELEKRTGVGKQLIIRRCYEGDHTEPTEAQREAAIADFKAAHPDWKEGDIIVLYWKDGRFEVPIFHTINEALESKSRGYTPIY